MSNTSAKTIFAGTLHGGEKARMGSGRVRSDHEGKFSLRITALLLLRDGIELGKERRSAGERGGRKSLGKKVVRRVGERARERARAGIPAVVLRVLLWGPSESAWKSPKILLPVGV